MYRALRQHRYSAILCDIDGTLALRGDRSPHDHDSSVEDAPNAPIVALCNLLEEDGENFILISGRDEQYRDVTNYWLYTHGILQGSLALFMRSRGDNRPDEVVKREIYETQIKPFVDVKFVLDDRNKVVKMWRELGLTCLQVAEGDF